MVDEVTKKTLAAIPSLKTKAGPRDGDAWVARLKEEYLSLIKVSQPMSVRGKSRSSDSNFHSLPPLSF